MTILGRLWQLGAWWQSRRTPATTTDMSPAPLDNHDIGLEALKGVFARMRIDDQWSIWGARHFEWWLHEFAQRISVSKPILSREVWVVRLMASTTIATDVPCTEATYTRLGLLNAHAVTLSAFVLDTDGTLRLVTSAVVHADTLWFALDLFALVASMQAADAQLKAAATPDMLSGGRCSPSTHPTSGVRREADRLGAVLAELAANQDVGAPSTWAGDEMAGAHRTLSTTSVLAHGEATSVTAEFPYGAYTSLLTMKTDVRHPQVGAGLHVLLRLFNTPERESAALSAVALNRLEAAAAELLDLQGSWCLAPNNAQEVVFTAFYPNVFCRKGMGALIAQQMSARAHWVASLIDPRPLSERMATAKPLAMRMLDPIE